MYVHRPQVPERDVFRLLSNERRRRSLEYIADRERTTVRELANVVARAECAPGTPSENVRTAVYVSLRQTHLPRLAEAELVDFDADTNEVTILPRARGVTLYLELVTRYGLTWGECYQYLGIVGFVVVLGSLLTLPGVSVLPPLAWTTVFLAAMAVLSAYQVWSDRFGRGHRSAP